MTWSNATYYFQNHSTNWILHSDYFKSLQDDKMHEDVSETYFINKNGYLKDSIQTSFNFAHEEHGGSLEHSAVVSTILEVDILLWKTSQSESAIIFALHHWCSAILAWDRRKSGNEKEINLDTSLSRFSMCQAWSTGVQATEMTDGKCSSKQEIWSSARTFCFNCDKRLLQIMLWRWYPWREREERGGGGGGGERKKGEGLPVLRFLEKCQSGISGLPLVYWPLYQFS